MPLPEDFGTAFDAPTAPAPAETLQPTAAPLGLPSDFGAAMQDDEPQESPLDMVERNAHLTAGQNSSSYFQDKQVADTLGLGVDLVSRNRETTTAEAFKANLIKVLSHAPGTAAFFAEDRHNLWAAKDEAQALAQIEQRWKELLVDPALSLTKQAAKAPFSVLGSLPYNAIAGAAGALDFVETSIGDALGTGSTGAFGAVRDWAAQNSQWITENILQSDLLALSDDIKGKGLYENPELILDPEWLTYNVGEAATSILPQLLAAQMTGGSTLIGSAIGGVQEGGDLYRELLNDGVDPQAAFSWSAFFGTTTMALNKFGLDAILGKGAIEKITSKAVKALISGGTEGVTEWLEEPFQAFSKGMAEGRPLEDVGAAVMESLKNIDVIPGAFLLGGGTSLVASVAEDRAQEEIARAAAYRDKLVETHKAVQATQIQQNDPALMEKFLGVAGLGEDVFIDGELLLQSPDLLQRLGVDQTLAEDAALSGRSVRVNTTALWTRLSEQELEGLKDDIRPAPSAMSAREADSYDPVQALRDIEEAAIDAETVVAEVVAVKDRMRQTLEARGLGETLDANWELASRLSRMLSPKGDPTAFVQKLNVMADVVERQAGSQVDQQRGLASPDQQTPGRERQAGDFTVNTEDAGVISARIIRSENGDVSIFTDKSTTTYNAEFAGGKTDEEIISYAFEPLGVIGVSATPAVNQQALQQDAAYAGVENEAEIEEAGRLWAEMGTESPYFKRWFGNTPMVDEDGEPIAVYHWSQSPTRFQVFDLKRSKEGFHFGSYGQAMDRMEQVLDGGDGGVLFKTYLRGERMITIEDFEENDPYSVAMQLLEQGVISSEDFRKVQYASDMEKDFAATFGREPKTPQEELADILGDNTIIRYENKHEGGYAGEYSYAVFNPAQIKSATGNRGTFDPADARILYQRADAPAEQAEDRKWAKHEPERTKAGKIKGAPEWVQDDKDLAKMRREMRKFVQEGLVGRFWYENSAQAVVDMVGGDVALAEKFIQLLAIYSPNSNVWVNSIQAVRAYTHWARGGSRDTFSVGSGDGDGKATSVLYDDVPWNGRKTNSFYLNLMYDIAQRYPDELARLNVDEEVITAITQPATIDVWMARAFGYVVEQFGNDKGSGQYSFAENEVRRLTARLNREREAGSPRWTPHQVQAAVWTAIKTRYEIQEVKDATNKRSQKQGLIYKALNDKGKEAWVYPKNAELRRKHLANWRHFAMQVKTEQVIAEAEINARSFGDDLQRMTNVVTWEANPSTAFGYDINNASPEVLRNFTAEARALLMDEDGNDTLALMLGVPLTYSANGFGAYASAVSPNNLAHLLPARAKGQEGFSAEEVRAYARAIQYIFKQDAVPWFRPENKALTSEAAKKDQQFKVINTATGRLVPKGRFDTQAEAEEFAKTKGEGFEVRGGNLAKAVVLRYDRALESADLERILSVIKDYLGEDAGFTRTADNEITLINFRDDQTKLPWVYDEAFIKAVDSFADDHGADFGLIENKSIWTEGEYGYVQDWSQDKDGRALISEGSLSRRPDLHPWLRSRRDAFEVLIERYSGDNLAREQEGVTLFQSAPVRGGGPQILRAGDVGRVRANYGEQAPGGRSVVGIHYSSEPRESLSGHFYGSGIKGAEAKRLDLSDDPRLKKRIHFYVDRGQGIRPEPGVGANIHAVNLNNLYDISEDPLGLKAAAYADKMVDPSVAFNNLESAIIDAGFDGILVPNAQTNNGVAVLLGDKHVNVPVDLVQPPRGGQAAQAAPAVPSVSARVIQEPDGSQRIMYTDNDTARIVGSATVRDGVIRSTEIRPAFEGKGFEQAIAQDLQGRGVDTGALFQNQGQSMTLNQLPKALDANGEAGILREKEVVYERADQGNALIPARGGDGTLSEERGMRPLPGVRLVELRTAEKRSVPAAVSSPRQAAAAMSFLSDAPQEQVAALVLDAKGRPLSILSHSLGTMDSSQIDYKALLGAIQDVEGASSFYLAHNHPAENAALSAADQALSENIRSINEGSGVSYGGLFAITPDKYADEYAGGLTYPAAGKQKKVAVVQRMFSKVERVEGLGPVSSPEDIKKNLDVITGGANSGVIFLTNKNVPVGFLPMTPSEMAVLRGDRLGEVLKSIHRTNATGLVGVLPNESALLDWRNVAAMANAVFARPLDALYVGESGEFESARMQGKDVDSRGNKTFYQRQQTGPRGAYNQLKDGSHLVRLFEQANASTMPHELAHAFLTELRAMAETGVADEAMLNDLQKIEAWLDREAVDGSPEWQSYYEDGLAQGMNEAQARERATFVQRHEKFSRGFEQYLWEGKAPEPELEGVFARFSRWLKEIYKTAMEFGVNLDPEIRSVFDRMLKADAEVESKVMELGFTPMTEKLAKHLGLGPEDRDYAVRLYSAALEKAEAKLAQARNKGLKKLRAEWKKDAIEEAKQSREHQMLYTLRKGRGIDKAEFLALYGDEAAKGLPRGVLREGGLSLNEAAFEHNYDTHEQMVNDLWNYRKPEDIAAEVVDARTAERDATFNVEDFILETAEFAAYQELMAKAYDKDGNVLSNKAFRDYARKIVATMPLADAMDVRGFLAAMARHHKAETKALKAGKLADAAKANKKARLNHAYAQEALNVRKRVEKAERMAKRLTKLKAGRIEEGHHKALLQLIQRFGLTKKDYSGLQDVPALADLVKLQDAFGADEEASFSQWLLSGEARNYKDLTSGEFEELQDLMKFLYGTGKEMIKPTLKVSGLTMDEVKEKIVPQIEALPKRGKRRKEGTWLRKMQDQVQSYLSQNRTILWIIRELDGYTALKGVVGPLEKWLYEPLEAANLKRAELSRQLEKRTRKARAQLLKSATAKANKVSLVDLPVPPAWQRQGRVWDFDACLSVLMNMGNAVNRQRVMDGYNLTDQDLQKILAVFSQEDAQAVQDIWDAMDEILWPEIAGTHKKLRFYTPGKVQAEAFTMPDGTVLRGGYYPLKYDPSADTRAARNQDLDKAVQNPATAMLPKSVASGATKARAASAGGMPVLLRTSVLSGHLDWAVHYASHALVIHDLGRILGDKETAEAIKTAAGEETFRAANELVKRIANPRAGDLPTFLDKVFGKLTGISAVYSMWMNRFGPLTQPTAIGNYIAAEGGWGKGTATWMKGAAHFLANPAKQWNWLMENNPALQNHFTLIRQQLSQAIGEDFRDIQLGKTKSGRIWTATKETVIRGGIAMYGVMDAVVSVPGWYGSYLRGLDENLSPEDAIIRANKVMAEYTPMSREMDKTLFQHTKGMARAWTYMMSYFTKQANTNAGYWKAWRQGAIKTDQFIGQIVAVQILPAVVVSMMYSLLTGDDDDRDNILLDAGLEVAAYPFAGLPFAREGAAWAANLARAGITGDTKKLGRNAFQMPGMMYLQLMQRAGSTTYAMVQDFDDDEAQAKALMAMAELTAATAGLPPVPKVAKEVMRGLDDIDDDEGNILNVLIKPKIRKRD